MKLRLPHRLQAALVAALASVSFTTLSSGTLSAAFFFGSQAFAEEAADNTGATIDIGDTNLDAQAAIDEEEGKGEAKEPGSAPINQAGFNGIRGSSDDADRAVATEVIAESSIDTENVGTAGQANYTGTSADLPSDDLGFTSNTYEASSDTSNGSGVDSPVTSFTQAPQIAPTGGYSAAGTGSGSSSNKTSPVSVFGNTGSGAFGGGSFGSGISLGSVTKAAPTPVVLGAASSSASNQTLHVYILTGQSNSLGAVKSVPLSQSKLDAYFTEGAMLWNANLTKGGSCFVAPDQQAWQDVVPQLPSYSSGGPSNLCMGAEYGFVHMLTRLSAEEKAPAVDADHLAIIKFSLDGGGNNYWDKNGSPTSYGTMLAAAERALLAAQTKGYTSISLDGLMYLQGESNSGAQASAADTAYLTFVSNLSTDLENWMQQENITDITVSFDTNSVLGEPMLGTTDRQTTNNKFIALANRDEHIGYVYTDDLGNIGDNLHFTGEAQLTIGARYAYAFAVQNDFNVGAVRGANKSAALDTAGAWWMEDMPLPTDVVKWDVSSCSTVNTISSSLTVGGILVEDPYNNAVFITGGSLDIGASGIEVQKGALNVSSAVNVASSQSWRSQNGFAINTTGNVTIASDATLTIQDGAVVNFHSIGGAGNLTLGTGSGLVSLGMSAQDFAAATPVGEAHYTEGDNGFFNGSRAIITVSGNLVIADGTTLGGMDGLTGAIFSVSDDHHSLYAAATSQTDYFVRSGKITYAAGTNAYAATGLILADKGSGNACLSLETSLKDNVSIQVSGTGNAIEIAEGVRLNKASLSPAANSAVTLKGDGMYIATATSTGAADFGTGVTLGGSADWHGILMLSGTNLNAKANLNSTAFSNASSWVGLSGVTNVDTNWNDGTITSNIYFEDTAAGNPAWKYNNGSSGATNRKTLTFSGKIAGNGTLLKTGSGNNGIYNQNYTFTGDVSGWTGLLRYEMSASDSANSVVTFSGKATTINASVDYTFTDAKVLQLALGSISDGSTGYTFNNAVKVHQLSATGQNITLGSHAKEDGTVTNGSLEISSAATAGTLTLGSGTTATFGGTTNLAGVNGTGGTLVVGGGNLTVSGSVGGTVAINLQSGSVGNISIASGSNVTLSQAGGTYGTVSVAADTTLTLGSALNVADMTFGSGAKLDATVDFMRSVTYSGTSTGYRDNSDTENGYQQYSDASFTLVTKSTGTAGDVQGAGLLESWTLVSTEDSVVAHGGTVKAGKYYVNTSVDYDAASSTNTAYTGASEMVLNSANATLNLLSNLNANACSGGITTAGGATAIASTINIGSGVTLNADQLTRKGSDTVTLAGSGTFAVAGINSTGKKFNAYDALPAGVSKGTSWFGCLSLNGNIEQLWLNQAPSGSTVRLDGVTGFMGGSSNDNDQIVAEVEIGAGGYTFTNANTGTRNFKGGFSGAGNLVHANQGRENSPNLVFSSNMENFTGSIINQKASAGFTLNFNTGASVVNAASIKNDGTAANMLITMNVNDATTFNTLIDKGQGNINLTVASGKSATFNGNTSVSSLSASGADVALGSGASLAVAGATTVDNLSLAGGNTVAFGNGLTYDTLSAEGVSSMSLSGAVSMGEYLMLGKGTLSVNNVQLDLARDAWDAALDREGSQYSDGESAVNGYATGMKLILARASRIDGAGYAAASGGSLAGMNLSIEVYGAEEDPECSVGGYAQHLVAMGADTSHTYFVNTEAEYDSSSATSGASTRLVMNRANASLSLASNLDSSVCVGGIVVEAQGTSVIVKSGVDLSAGDIHYGDTLTSICVEDQGTLVLEGFGGSAIALDRLTLEDGSALDLAALTTFAPAQQPVLLQGMGGGSGMMKVNSNAIGDFSGISLLGDAAPDSPQTVVLATAANGIELGSNVDLKNLVIPEQYQAMLSTQAAEGGGYNLVLTLGAASNDLIWDGTHGATWDTGDNWHAVDGEPGSTAFNTGDNVQFSTAYPTTATLDNNVTAGNMVVDSGATATVNTAGHSLTATSLTGAEGAQGGNLVKQGAGTATFNGDINLSGIEVQGGTVYVTDTDTTRGNVGEIKSTQGAALELVNVAATISGNNNQQLKGDLTIGNGALVTVTNTDNLDYNSTSTVTVGAGGELHFENGRWTVGGNNKLVLAGGSITGTGESSNGALDFMNANTVNVTDDSTISAPIRLRGSNVTFEVADTKNLTIAGLVNDYGTGSLTKAGDGTLTLSGNNTFTGNVTVNDGTLQLNSDHALGADNVSDTATRTITINQGGTIDLNGKDNGQYAYILNGGSLVNNGSATIADHAQTTKLTLTADSTIGGTNKFYLLASGWGATSVDMGNNVLEKIGSNEIVMWSTNVTNGGTILIRDGSLNIDRHDTGKTLSSLATNIEIAKGGADALKGNFSLGSGNTISSSVADASMSASVALKGATTLNAGADDTLAITGVLSNAANSTGSITKTGDGTVTLTGANTYTGGTTISNGALVTRAQTALGTGNVSVDSGATLQVETDLIIGGQSPNAGGTLTNNGTLSLQDDVDLELYAGTGSRTYKLGNVVVDGSASIMNRWNPATQNISSISGDAEDTLTLISNHCGGTGTWNIGQSNVAASPYSGKLVLQVQDTDGDNSRIVNFKILDGGLLSGATVELKNGPFKTSNNRTMTNNVELVADQVTLGGLTDGEPIVGTGTRTVYWNLAPTSQSSSTLELNGTSTYSTGVKVGANVSINKTGTGSQSFTGDLSAMNNGTVTATAGTLTLDNSSSTKGTLYSVTVNGGTLALDNMNVTDAVTLSSGTLDLMSATNVGSLNMTGGTLAMDGTNRLSSSTGNLAFTSGMLDLSGMTVEAGHDYILATTTSGSLTLGADVDFKLSNQSLKDQFTLQKQGKSLVLTFVTAEDLIWSGENGNWSSNHWHTETAPDTPVSFTDGHNVTFESGEAVVTLTQNVTAPTTTLESGAVVKVVSEQGGNYTLDTTLQGAGTFVLDAGATTLPSEVTLSSTDWHGVVRISGSIDDLNINDLGNNIASTIEFAGMEGSFCNPSNNTITLARNVVFSNAGDEGATPAIKITQGYSRAGGFQFSGNVSGTGTVQIAREVTQHFTFSGDVSHWDGEIRVTNCGSGNDGSWVKFTGSATEVNAAINQTGGGDFRVIADADTTFKDDISVTRMQVTEGHTATLEGDVTLTGSQGSQGKGITGSGAVNVAQGGTLTFASGVDTISGTLTVSEGATLKLSEMNDAAITTSGTLTLNSGSTLDLSSLTGITGHELTPITLVQQVQSGTITDTYLGGVNLVFARGVTGGKLSVQNSALVLTFIEPGKTLIWDNHAGNQTWSKGVDDANWHTPNNPSRHIGFEEYDIVQFTGKVATSVIMAEDVTPARMEVASGKTLTVYTEGNDLTIVQDLNASGASVVLDSEGKQGQATSVGGDAVAGNLQIVGGSVDVRGYLDVENKATVTSDGSLTAEHASNIGTLQVMGGTVDLKGKASVNSVELLEGMFPGSTSRATFESDSFVNALSVNSSELVNKGIMEMQNGAVMLSGTSSITGVGSINTASVRVVSGTTTIDGGQTINVTSANGITGTGTLNLGNATLTANTRSWILANTVGVTLTDGDNGAKLSATDYTLTVASNITGTGKLVKTGTGTVELTGSNSYTGGTDVNAGTLLIGSVGALTGDVNVGNGGRLSISETLVSSVNDPSVRNLTVAQGGTLRLAGENALAVTGTLTMAAGSTLDLSNIDIVAGTTSYTLASGGTFTVDPAVTLTFEHGIHPEQGTTPSLTVEGAPGSQTLKLNYVVNTPNNLIWDGGTASWNNDTAYWHAKDCSAGSGTFATYDNVIFDGTDIAGRGGYDTPTLSENVYATNMTVAEGNRVEVNTNGHRLDVDFLHAGEGSTITKTGNGTALIGIADNGFGADLTVTGGTLTAEYVDMNGAGIEVTGNLAANGGTLNVIIGRPETPTNIEFTSDSSVSNLSSILVDENSTAVFNGEVSVPQNVTVEVRDGAELVFGGNTNMSANRWLMTGEGSVHFTGPVTLSEETNNYEKIDGKLTVTFDDLTQGKANLTLRMQEGTDTNIGTLHLKGVQRCFYLTFQYDEQERGLLEIDTLDVADDDATHGIGSLSSRFGELQGYQQQGSISIAQLTGGGTVSLFNYAYDNNNASGRIGYDSPEVFYVGGKSVENKLFSGNIQLADGGFGVSEANKLKPKHTVLVLEDEIVASQSVIQINNADTGTGDNRNNGKYSNFGIGIDADNVKVQGIEDVALQSGNQVKIFSGSVGTETNASYGSDDTVRTLQLTGKSTDTAATTYSSSAGFDKNVDIVKQGAGTQVFSGDSSKFNGSIEVQEGVLEFSNTASLHIEDLTLGKDKVQQPALMKSAPLKALGSDAANVDTLAVRTDAAGENVGMAEVNGTLKAKSGAALDSNLTLASGSTLDVRDTLSAETNPEMTDRTDYVGGLDMLGNTLTLQSGAYLSNADRSALLSMQWGERYDLAYGLSSLTLGDKTTTASFGYEQGSENNIEASQYFQNLQEDDYYLCYSGSGSVGPGGNVGVFYIFKAPEPTTSTLSLLALAALAARRRRK